MCFFISFSLHSWYSSQGGSAWHVSSRYWWLVWLRKACSGPENSFLMESTPTRVKDTLQILLTEMKAAVSDHGPYFCLCTEWKELLLHVCRGTFLVFTRLHGAFIMRSAVLTPALWFKGHAEGRHRMKEGNSLAQTESMAKGLQKSALHCTPQCKCQFAQG